MHAFASFQAAIHFCFMFDLPHMYHTVSIIVKLTFSITILFEYRSKCDHRIEYRKISKLGVKYSDLYQIFDLIFLDQETCDYFI